MRLLDRLLFGRQAAIQKVPMVFVCGAGRQAALIEGANSGDDGSLESAEWFTP